MDWFFNWFQSLTLLQQILACFALPATVILIIQTVLLILGLGFGGDADGDAGCEHSDLGELDGECDDFHYAADEAAGIRILTVRGLVAMFSIGGWLGIAAVDLGVPDPFAAVIAIVSGLLALFLVAYLIRQLLKLQETGNLDARNAVAHTGRVYITVPASRGGTGKVMLTLQERLVEMEAVTDCGEDIKTDCMVQVVSVTDNVLVVRPLA